MIKSISRLWQRIWLCFARRNINNLQTSFFLVLCACCPCAFYHTVSDCEIDNDFNVIIRLLIIGSKWLFKFLCVYLFEHDLLFYFVLFDKIDSFKLYNVQALWYNVRLVYFAINWVLSSTWFWFNWSEVFSTLKTICKIDISFCDSLFVVHPWSKLFHKIVDFWIISMSFQKQIDKPAWNSLHWILAI